MTGGDHSDDFDEVAPDASAMAESMRAHGYTLPTAIADLADNSITAYCKNIWLRFEWDGMDSWVSVTDDGDGMSEEALISAMRLGSRSPVEERDPADLGRFGLGLKTASFSQARRLTVISRTRSEQCVVRRWDLDHLARPEVKGWQLLRTAHPEAGERIHELERRELNSGTQVLLEELDRVTGREPRDDPNRTTENHFVAEVARVRQHLAMVFHRFLSDPPGKRIRIFINDDPIEPWDPFVEDHSATQRIPADRFPVDTTTGMFRHVTVQGFVLPHRDRFDEINPSNSLKLHQEAGGPAGWNAQQGFYLYRNRRLIIPGDWLGLGTKGNGWKKEEHFKLARIRVDIPNSMDHEWQIDVKKSTAVTPPALRSWLTGLAKTVRERAKEVYAHRGAYGPHAPRRETGNPNPWVSRKLAGDAFSYRIDRKNPIFQALIYSLPSTEQSRLETLLRLIEETVPVQRVWIDTAENQDGFARPFEGEASQKLRGHILNCHEALCAEGMDVEQAWEAIMRFPAFQTADAQAITGELREAPPNE